MKYALTIVAALAILHLHGCSTADHAKTDRTQQDGELPETATSAPGGATILQMMTGKAVLPPDSIIKAPIIDTDGNPTGSTVQIVNGMPIKYKALDVARTFNGPGGKVLKELKAKSRVRADQTANGSWTLIEIPEPVIVD